MNEIPKGQRIAGHVLSVLSALVLIASGVGKVSHQPPVVEGFSHFGFPETTITPIGLVEMLVAALSLVPRARLFGVILISAYMGGAVATHVRLGEPFFLQMAIATVAWVGLGLRSQELRALATKS